MVQAGGYLFIQSERSIIHSNNTTGDGDGDGDGGSSNKVATYAHARPLAAGRASACALNLKLTSERTC